MSNVGPARFCHPGTLICQVKTMKDFHTVTVKHERAIPRLTRTTPVEYVPQALERVSIGAYGVGQGHKEVTGDGAMCYQHTVMFLRTRKPEHAHKAIDIINAWATKNKVFEGSNAPLEASWAVTSMVRSAEILKYAFAEGWRASGTELRLIAWIRTIIYPLFCTRISWTNNWNLTMAEARMQLAIFRDDRADFDWAVKEYRRLFAIYVTPWTTGQCGETKRDIIHAQFGIGSMLNMCEMAWHQGVDLYTPELHRCLEYHASILNGKVPSDLTLAQIKDNRFQPIGWEIGFQHFTKRRAVKLPMPETTVLLEKNRPEWCIFCWGLSTVTHCH
jgi:hypothetical protein